MKRFGMSALMTVLVLGLAMDLTACRRSRGGDEGNSVAGGTAISTPAQGLQAVSTAMQGVSMAGGSGTIFQNLGKTGLSAIGVSVPLIKTPGAFKPDPAMSRAVALTEKIAKSQASNAAASAVKRAKSQAMRATVPSSGTAACTEGGTATWDMIFNDVTNEFTADIAFASCRENDSVLEGVYHMTATTAGAGAADLTVTLGPSTPFTISHYSPGYGALRTKAVVTGFTLAIRTATAPDASSVSMTMTASGEMHVHDYFNLEDYELVFSNGYECAAVISLPDGKTASLSSNGEFIETWADASGSHSAAVTFRDLKLDTAATDANEDAVVSGAYSVALTPESCLNGAFTLATTAPVRYDLNADHPVSGAMTVDGVTTAAFNADGTVTVTTGTEGTTFGNLYELDGVCPIATLEEPAPVSAGLAGTASAANATTTITLTWNGPGGLSRSDMDLHVNYYSAQTPTATTAGTWFIDYHSGGSCVNPANLDLGSDTVDVDGDGVCDIGLDYDNTLGFGPEHLTATRLPAGYYVVSVNDFSSGDAEVPVAVSIQIGGNLFGPFTHTFTTANLIADGDGINAAAWFAVADMVVDDAGTATIKAHDAALELWHDGAFGMPAPKLAKGQ